MINQLKSPKVVFRVSKDPDLPQTLYSDPEKLEQLLLNLLLNAQKFTPSGWIKFKIQKFIPKKNLHITKYGSHETVDSNKLSKDEEFFIRFMVLDTGKGIEKERQQTIFNLFEQSQDSLMKESSNKK